MTHPRFLELDEILAIHDDRIRKYGGSSGIRDLRFLQSAMGNAAATFDCVFLHETVFEMAAAYLFGICRNHPFVDGNERTAVACALVFLRLNGERIIADEDDFYDLVIGVAVGRATKSAVAVFLEEHAV